MDGHPKDCPDVKRVAGIRPPNRIWTCMQRAASWTMRSKLDVTRDFNLPL